MSDSVGLVGAAVFGAIVGGGAQVSVAFINRSTDRKRWANDHRREIYLGVLSALRQFENRMAQVARTSSSGTRHFDITSEATGFYGLKDAVRFYGSEQIIERVKRAEEILLLIGPEQAVQGPERWATYSRDEVEPAIDALAIVMRRELGTFN
jgi:hypothetical protein